jgi:hypothetical protein
LLERSYERVNIMKAKQVVILTPNIGMIPKTADDKGADGDQDSMESDSKDSENLLDAKTIFKYNIIKKKNPNLKVVTELIN